MKTISFKTSFNTGDQLYHLSGINAVCEKNNAKADIHIWLDRIAAYYPGSPPHPVKDLTGRKEVGMNHLMFKLLKPLLECQPFINSVDTYNGEPINVDLDIIKQVNINQPYGDLRQWPGYVFSDMTCDISQQALFLPKYRLEFPELEDGRYILVNRTERYIEKSPVNYFFLKDYPVVFFVGVPKEYNIFKKEVPHAVHLDPENFLELAKLIKNAVMTVGNQSMVYAMAEQMKTPRVLEVCRFAPNVISAGPNGYPFLDQKGLEYFVNKLWREEHP